MCVFRVTSPKHLLNKILPHFYKYKLITQKQADYVLFKQIVMLIEQGKHLNKEGIQAIINIRASLNLCLSDLQKISFPKTIPVIRPSVPLPYKPHPEWLAGFIRGERCFFLLV